MYYLTEIYSNSRNDVFLVLQNYKLFSLFLCLNLLFVLKNYNFFSHISHSFNNCMNN